MTSEERIEAIQGRVDRFTAPRAERPVRDDLEFAHQACKDIPFLLDHRRDLKKELAESQQNQTNFDSLAEIARQDIARLERELAEARSRAEVHRRYGEAQCLLKEQNIQRWTGAQERLAAIERNLIEATGLSSDTDTNINRLIWQRNEASERATAAEAALRCDPTQLQQAWTALETERLRSKELRAELERGDTKRIEWLNSWPWVNSDDDYIGALIRGWYWMGSGYKSLREAIDAAGRANGREAGMSQVFYDWSGGMESSAMLVVERERIQEIGAIVRWADTGKQFPEMATSKAQIEGILGLEIVTVPRRITFEEFLFEKGGIIRKGTNDCSRRMKRGNLSRHMRTFDKPWEVNIGYNAKETKRYEEWLDLNERPFCHWRAPLIEAGIYREDTWEICRKAGFTILIEVYERMGRFDCYFCGNQKPEQALKVAKYYPALTEEWIGYEERKGHSFLPIPLKILVEQQERPGILKVGEANACSCFGGQQSFWDDEELDVVANSGAGTGGKTE